MIKRVHTGEYLNPQRHPRIALMNLRSYEVVDHPRRQRQITQPRCHHEEQVSRGESRLSQKDLLRLELLQLGNVREW